MDQPLLPHLPPRLGTLQPFNPSTPTLLTRPFTSPTPAPQPCTLDPHLMLLQRRQLPVSQPQPLPQDRHLRLQLLRVASHGGGSVRSRQRPILCAARPCGCQPRPWVTHVTLRVPGASL